MRFLVLGGTRFLGRHLVEAAVERGHTVTTFTRGQAPTHEHAAVLPLGGDRDPAKGAGLAAIASGTWDAVFDTSGYVPRIVGASCDLLESRVRRYLFVSSLSVYADTSRPGVTEDAPRARLEDPDTEDVAEHYGALKAACEDRVAATFGPRATVIRPGLIVGPHDPTDRFTYWVARFTQPQVLGERDDEAAVPAPPDRPIQLIDARDLAQWMVTLAERDIAGTYNAISPPRRWTMADLVETLLSRVPRDASVPTPVWIDLPVLKNAGIEPWTELPLWLPQDDAQFAGFFLADDARARETGLVARPLGSTVADVSSWLAGKWRPDAWQRVLTVERERRLVALQAERA
ncbi:MAG TPA: NAD-dependent epimerase/dehydratase family protein [Casimicrobiaceae bacterium]|nr:NAD-dependent epimerase/dehydratase family protein [Casimicrobiaceae bacterium]